MRLISVASFPFDRTEDMICDRFSLLTESDIQTDVPRHRNQNEKKIEEASALENRYAKRRRRANPTHQDFHSPNTTFTNLPRQFRSYRREQPEPSHSRRVRRPCDSRGHSVVLLCGGVWRHLCPNWRALGHFVAPEHRAGLILESRARDDLPGRSGAGYGVRLAGFKKHLLARSWRAGRHCRRLGISRPSGRVGCDLGRVYNAAFRPVRQLVAQRLRPGRANHQPASRGAGPGNIRDSHWRLASGALLAKSRAGGKWY